MGLADRDYMRERARDRASRNGTVRPGSLSPKRFNFILAVIVTIVGSVIAQFLSHQVQSTRQPTIRLVAAPSIQTVVAPIPSATAAAIDTAARLAPDRPFPPSGSIQVSLPQTGVLGAMTYANKTENNVIAMWFYNTGQGEREALRAYVGPGQSVQVTLPIFQYRLATYSAPSNLGLDRGFGPNTPLSDLGFVDLRSPAGVFIKQFEVIDYGSFHVRHPGVAAR